MDLGPEHHQPWGLVHGGVYTTAIESAATIGATAAASKDGLVAVGVNNNTNFLRSMISGRVGVLARPIQQGRTQQLWEVSISDADGRLVAVGLAGPPRSLACTTSPVPAATATRGCPFREISWGIQADRRWIRVRLLLSGQDGRPARAGLVQL